MNLDEFVDELIEDDLIGIEETALLMESDSFALHEEMVSEIETRGSLKGSRIA